MIATPEAVPLTSRQSRHSVAAWLGVRSLRTRLLLIVAAIVAVVVSTVTVLEVRSFERTSEDALMDAARQTALAVADDLRVHPSVDPAALIDKLHEFAEADPVIHSISIVRFDDAGAGEVPASTQSEEREDVIGLARRALDTQSLAMDQGDVFVSCAAPVSASPAIAAVSTVSLASVAKIRGRARTIALASALPIVVLVTLLVDLTTRRLVHHPVAEIRETMSRAAEGALSARAVVVREDELGDVAHGLNAMLERLEHFNAALQDRVREATTELRVRNAQLEESMSQLLILREALARAERLAALGQMAATVAHQAGTPLNLVSGYVQMLRQDPATDPRVTARLQIVDTQIQQVTRVLRSMLDQARLPFVREATSIGPLISRVTDLAAPRLAADRVELVLDVARDLPLVHVDVVQFELALLALVSNALDAMPGGGALTIRATSADGRVRLEVADTGTGIAPSILQRLFEPGVTTKPLGQGTGLGLGIVRDVVRVHGGTVSARNRDDGGAVFTIDLPIA